VNGHAYSYSYTGSDAGTTNRLDVLTLGHNSSGTPSGGFGSAILFKGKSDTTVNRDQGRIASDWVVSTDGSRASRLRLNAANNAGISSSGMYLYQNGCLSINDATDHGTGVINAGALGFKVGGTSTSGAMLQGDGTTYIPSTSTWPTSAGTAGKVVASNGTNFAMSSAGFPINGGGTGTIIISNGTNWIASTPTWPTAAGAAGYTIRSDATNFASYPAQLVNSSVASQSPSTSDVYLAGSNIVVTAGDMKAKGQYKCVFDMTKSAGTGAIVISLRVGVNGTTADTAIQTYTFGAGTSVADTGVFEVIATWRTVGSGTSAVIQSICRGTHNLPTTGLFNNAAGFIVIGSPSPSAGFNSSTATNIGISFNGSTAFAGTTQVVQAQLQQ